MSHYRETKSTVHTTGGNYCLFDYMVIVILCLIESTDKYGSKTSEGLYYNILIIVIFICICLF